MNDTFDARGMRCPLAFVKTKQQLIKGKAKVFLFDDEISLYNFTHYLTQSGRQYQQTEYADYVQITLILCN